MKKERKIPEGGEREEGRRERKGEDEKRREEGYLVPCLWCLMMRRPAQAGMKTKKVGQFWPKNSIESYHLALVSLFMIIGGSIHSFPSL